ncbi:MAG TPA: glycosyltransferase [Polyangiaceae bacterium]|nr:glycosyltransferase [Polyangiaceae bacterium]
MAWGVDPLLVLAVMALVVVLYTYAAYGALVIFLGKFAPKPIRGRADYEPTVSVCLAVHNGSQHITKKLLNLPELEYPPEKLEFLVFSDGSTDSTNRLVAELALLDPRIRLLVSERRCGKPAALNRMRAAASGEVLLLCDVRQLLAKKSLRSLVNSLSDPSIGCASGSLILTGNSGAGAYWRYEHLIRVSEARLGSTVGVSGCLYAVRRAEMPELPDDILLDDMYVPLRMALSDRKRIVFAEGAQAYDDACDDEHEFPRKVRTLAGNYQLFAKLPSLLVPGVNPMWFQLTSHKLLRLLCPWALVVLFLSSGSLAWHSQLSALATVGWRAMFGAQVVFYALAMLGSRASRIGILPRTFVLLNVAALFGLWRFLRGTQAVTW